MASSMLFALSGFLLVQLWPESLVSDGLRTPVAARMGQPPDVKTQRIKVIPATPLPDALAAGVVSGLSTVKTEHIGNQVANPGAEPLRLAGVSADVQNAGLMIRLISPPAVRDHVHASSVAGPVLPVIETLFKKATNLIWTVPCHGSLPLSLLHEHP